VVTFHERNGLRYLVFDALQEAGIVHGIFSRLGGVSPAPWASLNVGGMVGDQPENIIENRQRIFKTLGRRVESLYDCWLIHSNQAIKVDSPRPLNNPHKKADILLTDQPGITLFMRFADCVPILLYDPIQKVIGLAHAGWVGTINRVALTAVQKMCEWYGCNPENIYGYIGPAIGVEHYPVGSEVVEKARKTFQNDADDLIQTVHSKPHLDLWESNRVILNHAGVQNVEVAGICTACHKDEWFSHRAENGKTGRFGAIITLGAFNGITD
jgi:YfiH family protein